MLETALQHRLAIFPRLCPLTGLVVLEPRRSRRTRLRPAIASSPELGARPTTQTWTTTATIPLLIECPRATILGQQSAHCRSHREKSRQPRHNTPCGRRGHCRVQACTYIHAARCTHRRADSEVSGLLLDAHVAAGPRGSRACRQIPKPGDRPGSSGMRTEHFHRKGLG